MYETLDSSLIVKTQTDVTINNYNSLLFCLNIQFVKA